jgi:hypothetical protein
MVPRPNRRVNVNTEELESLLKKKRLDSFGYQGDFQPGRTLVWFTVKGCAERFFGTSHQIPSLVRKLESVKTELQISQMEQAWQRIFQ